MKERDSTHCHCDWQCSTNTKFAITMDTDTLVSTYRPIPIPDISILCCSIVLTVKSERALIQTRKPCLYLNISTLLVCLRQVQPSPPNEVCQPGDDSGVPIWCYDAACSTKPIFEAPEQRQHFSNALALPLPIIMQSRPYIARHVNISKQRTMDSYWPTKAK